MSVFLPAGVVSKFAESLPLPESLDSFDFPCSAVICVSLFLPWLLFTLARNLFCSSSEKLEKFDGNPKYRYDILMQSQMYSNSSKLLTERAAFLFGENGSEIIKEHL